MQNWFALISGARRDALNRAPAGAAQAATLGALLLLTATIAGFAGGYALHQVFTPSRAAGWIAAAGGISWGAFVFCVDRALILGIDKAADPGRLALQVLVRVPMAVILALAMSTPLLLKICEGPIGLQLRQERQELWLKEFNALSEASGLPELRKAISQLKATRDAQRERLLGEPDSFQYRRAVEELRSAERRLRNLTAELSPRINRARTEIQRLLGNPKPDQARVDSLRRQVADWQAQLSRAGSDVSRARSAVHRAAGEWQTQIAAAVKSAEEEISKLEPLQLRAAHQVEERGAQAERDLSDLLRANLVNEYKALRRITSDRNHPDSAAIRALEVGLHALFIILELTPVLIKVLSRRTTLDFATEAAEFLETERINLNANREAARLREATRVATALEAAAYERWANCQAQALQQHALTTTDLGDVLAQIAGVAA